MFAWILYTCIRSGRPALPLWVAAALGLAAATVHAQPYASQPVLHWSAPTACGGGACLVPPIPHNTGKPTVAEMTDRQSASCAGGACRVRIIGVVPGRGGAIELRATALKW